MPYQISQFQIVAAQPGNENVLRLKSAKPLGKVIARNVAERIIDFFEGIDIDQGQVNRSANGIALFKRLFD